MLDPRLAKAVSTVPPGKWAVGVSGGADSVALLTLLRSRGDLELHVVHLDHQVRGRQSAEDAEFVRELATRWDLSFSMATRAEIEPNVKDTGGNLSAHFRALRLLLFAKVVQEHQLAGVILAHHADDQAETVLQRLLRGSGYHGLCGMSGSSRLGHLRIQRPLLDATRAELRTFLQSVGQPWREDPSNASDKYLRNRLRQYLAERPQVSLDLLNLAATCRRLRRWAVQSAPKLDTTFHTRQLADLPAILARASARRWLLDRNIDPRKITPHAIDQLITMAADAASPSRVDFPGALTVRRRQGGIFASER